MKYTDIILTIIAACLIFEIAHSFTQKPIPVTVQSEEKAQSPAATLDVRIVAVDSNLSQMFQPSKPVPVIVQNQTSFPTGALNVKLVGVTNILKVDIASIAGDTIEQVDAGQTPLPINITGIGGDDLQKVDDQTVLPVSVDNTVDANVKNTVETDINGVDGHLVSGLPCDGLPVGVIQNP